jgi:hypothetical protein
MSRGYITWAVKQWIYLEFAVDLGLSLKETNPEPLSIIVDRKLFARAERYHTVFDKIILLPADFTGYCWGGKFFAAEAAPYERTMYLDSDILAIGSLGKFWDALETCNFAFLGEMIKRGSKRMQEKIGIERIMQDFDLVCYQKSHGGMFYFEKATGVKVLKECWQMYLELFTPNPFYGKNVLDEIIFAVYGGRKPVHNFPWPGPIPWPVELAVMKPGYDEKPLIHFIGQPSVEGMFWLMEGVRARRRKYGLPMGHEWLWYQKAWLGHPQSWMPLGVKCKMRLSQCRQLKQRITNRIRRAFKV